ncbi:hypothetical protein GCM10023157_33740 [Gluconacetobacter asukensis]|uniref:Helix-turn-helix transcriptional regulator n=2 Tax=Gluconacetobacter asukensis TaxID=1017181 RepID=A0A7W4J3V4_9PROT|nr:helix-turn-helix transcriptional regulator [Gluconacetobacter asukensis]
MARYDRNAQERTYKAYSIGNDTVMPRIRHTSLDCSPGCAVEATLELIDGKWKGVILYHLLEGTLRFNAIRKRLPNVTQRMLTMQLRELERDGFLLRTVYPQVPPRVEYSLTERGRSLEPVIMALKRWGDRHTTFGRSTAVAEAAQ